MQCVNKKKKRKKKGWCIEIKTWVFPCPAEGGTRDVLMEAEGGRRERLVDWDNNSALNLDLGNYVYLR